MNPYTSIITFQYSPQPVRKSKTSPFCLYMTYVVSRWHKLDSIGSPPTGRYCHSCGVVGKQVLLFGGTNAVQYFDSLIRVSVDMGSQLNSLAESLANMSNRSDAKVSYSGSPEFLCSKRPYDLSIMQSSDYNRILIDKVICPVYPCISRDRSRYNDEFLPRKAIEMLLCCISHKGSVSDWQWS